MAENNNANIGFEKQIWDAACVLWGHIPAAEYRKVIIGLIFLRYISSAFEKRYQELVAGGIRYTDCSYHSNSLNNKMCNSLLTVRDINHKYIVVG